MAYMSQSNKKTLAPGIKAVLKKYGMKGTISVGNHSTLMVTLTSGKIDFGTMFADVNTYWIHDHYEGVAKNFLMELKEAMMVGNYDHSDIQTDYFCVGWYISIRIGKYNKPYIVGEVKTVRSLMNGKPVRISKDTPFCCDPSTETYWSM